MITIEGRTSPTFFTFTVDGLAPNSYCTYEGFTRAKLAIASSSLSWMFGCSFRFTERVSIFVTGGAYQLRILQGFNIWKV